MNELETEFKKIENIDLNLLKREGKDFSFSDIYEIVEDTYKNIEAMARDTHYWERLVVDSRLYYMSKIKEMINRISEISKFKPTLIPNPGQQRNGIATTFAQFYHSFSTDVILPFTVYNLKMKFQEGDIKDQLKNLNEYVSQAKKAKENVDSIQNELQTKALGQTVSNYSQIFQVEANKHKRSAGWWLFFGGVAMLLFLASTIFLYSIFKDETSLNVTQVIFKVAILVALLFIVTFTFKQYSINKHLYTLNKHRENTLNSYKLFIDSIRPEDNDVRNAIMMQVSRAIYEQGKTGYINEKGSEPENPSIIELIRTVQKSQ